MSANLSELIAIRKEVEYRLSYRSMLELDSICRCLIPALNRFNEQELKSIRDFLLNPEPNLQRWLVQKEPSVQWQQQINLILSAFQAHNKKS